MDPTLINPKADFFVAGLLNGWHLEEVDFDFFATIKIGNDGIGEFGESTGSDVAASVVMVFIHKKEDISTINILEEGNIDILEVFGVITFGRHLAREVDDFVATTFEIAPPVSGALL